ncbi:MAG: hypothetical protein ACERJ1_17855 [Halodesulfovibrio sp.]|uniref:hypothetical protein n=1 Tax=Halodesulfovibrio sp. TaxID=1912772 RepID=UPI00359D2524
MQHLRTIKILLILTWTLAFLFTSTVAFAEIWSTEDKQEMNVYSVYIEDGSLDFSFVFNNGQQIGSPLNPVKLQKMSNGCFIAKKVIGPHFNQKFDVILCHEGDSLVWAKLTADDVLLIPNWLLLKKYRE